MKYDYINKIKQNPLMIMAAIAVGLFVYSKYKQNKSTNVPISNGTVPSPSTVTFDNAPVPASASFMTPSILPGGNSVISMVS